MLLQEHNTVAVKHLPFLYIHASIAIHRPPTPQLTNFHSLYYEFQSLGLKSEDLSQVLADGSR